MNDKVIISANPAEDDFTSSVTTLLSEVQLHDLFDDASDLIQSVAPDGHLLFVNRAWCRALGYSAEEATALNVFDVIHPEYHGHCHDFLQRIAVGENAGLMEIMFLTKDGRAIVAEGHVSMRVEDGRPVATRGIFRNITERKAAEAEAHAFNQNLERLISERTNALRASEERYRYLMSTVPGAVYEFCIDAEGHRSMPFISERIVDLIGLSAVDIMVDVEVAFQRIPADAMPAMEQSIRHSLENLSPWLHEFPIQTTSGETRRLHGHSLPCRQENGATYWTGVLVDITERKQMEDRLRATQYAIDHATDYIFVIGSNGCFLDVNESACCRLGYTKQELLTKSVMDIDPDLSPAVWKDFWEEFKQTGLLHLETRHCSKSGEIYPVEVVANYILHEGKELDYAFVRDITERRRTEDALRESEERYRHLMATVPGAVYEFRIDAEGHRSLPFMSNGIAELMGLSPTESMIDAEIVFQRIPADALPALEESIRRSLETLSPWLHEFPIQTVNGEAKWLRGHSVPRREENDSTVWHGVLVDITERKQMEEALRASEQRLFYALNATSEGLRDWSIQTGTILFSSQWIASLGYSPDDVQPSVDFWKSIIHPDDLSGTMAAVEAHFARHTPFYECENRLRMKSGHYRHNLDRGQVVEWSADGSPLRMVGTDTDITERKLAEARVLAEQELRAHDAAMQELVTHVERMREEDRKYIAREIHDELGQILVALRLEASLLQSAESTNGSSVDAIKHNMVALVDKAILGIRNVAANLRPAVLELGVIPAIRRLSDEFTKHTGVNCVLRLMESQADLDEEQTVAVFRIVQESLTNVMRHAAASHVEIILMQSADHLLAEVHDNGKGFDPANTGNKVSFGLLGMRERAAALGGAIDIASVQQQGTVVSVRIPIKRNKGFSQLLC